MTLKDEITRLTTPDSGVGIKGFSDCEKAMVDRGFHALPHTHQCSFRDGWAACEERRATTPVILQLVEMVKGLREALDWYARCDVAGKACSTTGPGAHSYYDRDDGSRAKHALSQHTLDQPLKQPQPVSDV